MEIKLKNITYYYKKMNYQEKKILDNINLTFEKHCIHTILGSTGSGKTTLAELIAGIIQPTEGEIFIDQQVYQKKMGTYPLDVGIVFQNCENQFLNDTVEKELVDIVQSFHYRIKDMKKRISSSLLMVGLDDSYLDRKIVTLSTSEKQKLIFASVLLLNPKVIILDDPIISMDRKNSQQFKRFLKLLTNRYHKTIIILSNNSDFALYFSDYVTIMSEGKVIGHDKKINMLTQIQLLKKAQVAIPKIIEFEDYVAKKKNIKLGYRDDIQDLIKDIYRNTY